MDKPNLYWIVFRGPNRNTVYRMRSGWTERRAEAHKYTYAEATEMAREYGYRPDNGRTIEPVIKQVINA